MPKILQMPKRDQQQGPSSEAAPVYPGPLHPVLPHADEEHASLAAIDKWVSLADVALGVAPSTRKKA